MKSAVLKGKGQSYYLEIIDESEFSEALRQVENLLTEIQNQVKNDSVLSLTVDTQKRLLTDRQKNELRDTIAQFSVFHLQQITSQVVSKDRLQQILSKKQLEFEPHLIRSGQIREFSGNVLLLGDLHAGAQLRAGGSVFIMGKAEGIIHAGYPDDDKAVVVGNLANVSQVRISDLIQIISDLPKKSLEADSFFSVNDLHALVIDSIENLLEVKPQTEIVLN
ncbi:hypothetical protein MOO45_03360 [Bombilactobacillus folatiphilus]|uniref:Probable septum site-determining protein MinC n=1 Tax=Bombilactobacillus folatiphilus TaxID=2923362 RepID=A0ABY4PAM8_9LACO|nr:septum site-determining protein MinC [Bombilactobacillus folatiphilus]UQS82694.1 hypothetical protein MOO45_03360 [Bombilactobacillus folatiphilus]